MNGFLDAAVMQLFKTAIRDELEAHRMAVRADVRKALAERQLDDRLPEVSGFDTRAAAAYIGVSTRTIARLKSTGRLPHARIGRQIRYRREDLDALLADRE